MQDDGDVLTLKSVGIFFPAKEPPIGVWTAGLLWQDDETGPQHRLLKGESQELATTGRNIGADVLAILNGLREARPLGLPVEVYSVNESVVKTISDYFDRWRENGWRKSKGGRPENLEEWKEIKEITEAIPVSWHKRKRGKVDTVADYEAWRQLLEDEDNSFWMQRAIGRDRS